MSKVTFTEKMVTSSEALEKAGLNWNVRQAPVLFEGNGLTQFTGRMVNYRDDTGDGLGTVTAGYKLLQHKTGAALMDSCVGSSLENFVAAGEFGGGKKIFLQAKLPGDIQFAGNRDDRGEKLITFITSHDGTLPVSLLFTPVRIVCQNTFNAALRSDDHVKGKHTFSLSLDVMRNQLGILNRRMDILAELSEKLATTRYTSKQLKGLLQVSGLIPKTDEQSTRAENIWQFVDGLFQGNGKGSEMKGSKGTAWGAWNAVTEYIDHHRTEKGDTERFESALLGSGAKAKELALAELAKA